MVVDQLLDAVMRDQEIPPPDEPQQGPPRDRENVGPRQAAPDGLQLQYALQRGIAGIVGPVEGADTGADHHIGGNPVRGERMHHAHLNGAEAAPAREDKGRPGPAGMNGYRQGFDRSFIDALATGPRSSAAL